MGYSAGILTHICTVINPETQSTDYGMGSVVWTAEGTFHCALDWTRGARAMREGELQAYDVVMFRMRYNSVINEKSRLLCDGKYYAIDSFHSDSRKDTIQVTATEIESFTYTES